MVAYESNINIIHDVSNIFPVALYFMAALVTFVTMGRFVEEERGKAGIFNALGYSNSRIIHKFVIYGLITKYYWYNRRCYYRSYTTSGF
ncbi:MAG: FtsX-like permease family protein [Streptococcus salivarius]